MDMPNEYKSRARAGDDFVNIIFKMMRDGYDDEIIYHYLRKIGITTPRNTLWVYISAISKENFPNRKRLHNLKLTDNSYPADVIAIQRADLLRYILTTNPKKPKDKTIADHIEIIKARFPIVEWVETVFHEFHNILKGNDPDKVDEYIKKYEESLISSFCTGLKKDIAPVKNAVSLNVNSGFVEGNNNKFKVIKRIVYGRSNLTNLSKKCNLAFLVKTDDFNLLDIL